MRQRGTHEITEQTTEPQLRDVKFLHLPACRRKVRFFVAVGMTEVISLWQPKAGTSWLFLHLGWCQQQLWAGCETLWASLTQQQQQLQGQGMAGNTSPASHAREQQELVDRGWGVQQMGLERSWRAGELVLCRETARRGSFKCSVKV